MDKKGEEFLTKLVSLLREYDACIEFFPDSPDKMVIEVEGKKILSSSENYIIAFTLEMMLEDIINN